MSDRDPQRAPQVERDRGLFVGREAELRRLEDLFDRACEGSGSVALITGDAGIGKTALAGAFLRRVRGAESDVVLCRGRCVRQFGTGEAYLPFLDALGSLLMGRGREDTAALLKTYAPTWCIQLPAIAVPAEVREVLRQQTIGATRERMLREMGDVLEAAASANPLVGFLEDVQWIDGSSADLVRHLANRIERQRILLIGTARPADVDQPGHPMQSFFHDLRVHPLCHEILLKPLDETLVAAYLDRRFLPHAFPASLPRMLHLRTEGHPLFITSLVDYLAERGYLAQTDGAWALVRDLSASDLEIPEGVRGMVRYKAEALAEQDRSILQYASVVGRDFTSALLARLLETEEVSVEEKLSDLERRHRLVEACGEEELPDGSLSARYRFVHSLYQEVLYEDLLSRKRTLMHAQVGEQLVRLHAGAAPRVAAQLAFHFERGRQLDEAVTFLVHAGDNAALLYANEEAEQHFRRALGLLEKLPEGGRGERALLLQQKRGAAHLAASRFDAAAEVFSGMLEIARALRKPALEGAALSGLCNALFFSSRIEETAVRASEALCAAEAAGDETLRVEALLVVAQIVQQEGSLRECRELLDDLLPAARALGHGLPLLAGLTFRGIVHYWQSEYALAEERLGEALALAKQLRTGHMVLICLQFLGLAQAHRGRMSAGLATLEEGVAMGLKNGDRFWLPRLASHRGFVHRELQDFGAAIEHDQRGLAIAREYGVRPAEASALLNLCSDYTHAGRLDEAAASLAEIERVRSDAGWFGWLYDLRLRNVLAEYWWARGDRERARQHGRSLAEAAVSFEARSFHANANRLLGAAALAEGLPEEAAAQAQAAVELLHAHPTPLVAWKTLALLSRIHVAAGRPEPAAQALEDAARSIDDIAAGVADPRLRQTFLESPAVSDVLVQRRRPKPPGRSGPSPGPP